MRDLDPTTDAKVSLKPTPPGVTIELSWDQALALRALLYDPLLREFKDHPWFPFIKQLHTELHSVMKKQEEDPDHA